jgi:hypothetical protein
MVQEVCTRIQASGAVIVVRRARVVSMPTRNALALIGLFCLAACSDSTEPEVLAAPSRDGWESTTAFPGYTLIGPLRSRRAYLVDMSGTAVHSWLSTGTPGVAMYLTERGTLLRGVTVEDHPIFRGGGMGGRIEELDWDGTLLWELDWDSETGISHHDFEELPNGNVLIIAWDRLTRAEALAAGRDPELLEGEELWPDTVYEIRPKRPKGGEVVWVWRSWDHLVVDGEPRDQPERIAINGDRNVDPPTEEEEAAELAQMAALGYVDDGGGGEEDEEEDPEEAAFKARIEDADWLHTNAIDYDAELDQIALSVRRFDEVWIIDHSTTTAEAAGSTGGRSGKGGDLLYRWGNPFAYGLGTWDDRQLIGQHHVQWIPKGHLGAGSLIVFDNGTDKERAWSAIKEWWAPRDAEGNYVREEGRPFGPAEPDWVYEAPDKEEFYSSFISGVQRLPNGNTLICSGNQGWVFEVTPTGEVVWDWMSPYARDPEVDDMEKDEPTLKQTALFRADRYAADHPGIVALRERGAPIPLDPGAGPATNQYVEPEETKEESEEEQD